MKYTLWPFRKRPKNLSAAEQERLKRLLSHSPTLRRAYTLREELELIRIFDTARSKADRLRWLGFWHQRVARSGLTCFDAFLKLLER